MSLSISKLSRGNFLLLAVISVIICSCGRKPEFSSIKEILSKADRKEYKTIYLIGENSCTSCYEHIKQAEDAKSIVYVFSKSGSVNGFKDIFRNIKVERNFSLIDSVAMYTKDFKGPYKIDLSDGEITGVVSFNN